MCTGMKILFEIPVLSFVKQKIYIQQEAVAHGFSSKGSDHPSNWL